MRLAHLHLPHRISYTHSLRLQSSLLGQHFAYKDALRAAATQPTSATHSPPDPTVLTFSTDPTYTVGRRHLQSNPISASQQSFLTDGHAAEFYASPRGGLLTYHGPGQLTAYPIIDLRRHGITPRCYIRLLEKTVMRTCARFGVLNTTTTSDPGVWISDASTGRPTDRKICAIGVQVSRGITTHGIGLNVLDEEIAPGDVETYHFTDSKSDPHRGMNHDGSLHSVSGSGSGSSQKGYLTWGFGRIVACGLEGKEVTWLSREGAGADVRVHHVAEAFVEEFMRSLNKESNKGKDTDRGIVSQVYRVNEADVLATDTSHGT